MALGAQASDVLRLILGQGVSVDALGLIVGLATAWALGRAMTTFVPLARADWPVRRRSQLAGAPRSGRYAPARSRRLACRL